MVNQSELAFRMLARQYGAELCYTPMLHSTLFAQEEVYRRDNFDPHAADRPLVAQFCGDDPATLLAAARHVQGRCDAVDLNLGCPQAIARKGHYGAFLLPERDLVVSLVRALAGGLSVPVTAKIRLLPGDIDETISLALALQEAGCSVLTVHGRTREQKCSCTCDWAAIAKVKAALSIPVIANGGVEHPADIGRLLAATGCDGAMLSEAALENPAIFGGAPVSRAGQIGIARAYLARARTHPPRSSSILKAHLFKVLFMALDRHRALRERLGAASDVDDALAVVDAVEAAERAAEADADRRRRRPRPHVVPKAPRGRRAAERGRRGVSARSLEHGFIYREDGVFRFISAGESLHFRGRGCVENGRRIPTEEGRITRRTSPRAQAR